MLLDEQPFLALDEAVGFVRMLLGTDLVNLTIMSMKWAFRLETVGKCLHLTIVTWDT